MADGETDQRVEFGAGFGRDARAAAGEGRRYNLPARPPRTVARAGQR
jgi:hypothetical protein